MGVGVYTNDFNGTGGTFLISDPRQDGDDEGMFVYDDILDVLHNASASLGITSYDTSANYRQGASFDKEFQGVAEGPVHGIGVRGWEDDYVIGVGAKQYGEWNDMLANRDSYAIQIIERTGRSPEAFGKLCDELSENILTYMRLSLQEEGYECRFRTSGYTTGKYELLDDGEAEIERLGEVIRNQLVEVQASPKEAFNAQAEDERAQTMRTVFNMPAGERWEIEKSLAIIVPLYNHEGQSVMWVNPIDGEFVGGTPASIDLVKIMEDVPNQDGLSSIPRDGRTEAWYVSRQKEGSAGMPNMKAMIVSADEYAKAVDEDLVVKYDNFASKAHNIMEQGRLLMSGYDVKNADDLREKCVEIINDIGSLNDKTHSAYRDVAKATISLLAEKEDPGASADNLSKLITAAEVAMVESDIEITVGKRQTALANNPYVDR